MKDVYTITDLDDREQLDAGADKPAKLAVIGWPVAHSASPQMHQAALDALDIDARYIRLEVPEGRTAVAFDRMRELGFIGCNVTVPHKLSAIAYCDEIDPTALRAEAVNTIRFAANASLGFSTDGTGFYNAIKQEFGLRLDELDIAITGAGGGAGQAIAAKCVDSGVKRLVLINRTTSKLDKLIKHLESFNKCTEIIPLSFDSGDLERHCKASGLIVNTTSVGLKQGDPSILPDECLSDGQLVYDTIYKPAETPLLKLAAKKGAKTANGLSMLIQQGAISFTHWFPGTQPLRHMQQALRM